jgi:hypothetical protein
MGRLLEATLDELSGRRMVIDNEDVHGSNIRHLPKRKLNGCRNNADLLLILSSGRRRHGLATPIRIHGEVGSKPDE